MTVVFDTNVVIQALNPKNPLAPILDAWYGGEFVWALSTDILLEYREILTRQSGEMRWRLLERLLDLSVRHRANVRHIAPSYHFLTIPGDRDDDKFADCAITAHADYIVTSDRHFKALEGSGYKAQPITPLAFISRLRAK